MRAQVEFCEAVCADLALLFPDYPSTCNAQSVKPGGLLTVTIAAEVARRLLDAYDKPAVLPGMEHDT
jgi:hypothetical protein